MFEIDVRPHGAPFIHANFAISKLLVSKNLIYEGPQTVFVEGIDWNLPFRDISLRYVL